MICKNFQGEMLVDHYSKDSSPSDKAVALQFHISVGPQGNMHHRHTDVINASTIGGSYF